MVVPRPASTAGTNMLSKLESLGSLEFDDVFGLHAVDP